MRPPDSCIHGQRCVLCHRKLLCASLQVCKYKGEQYTLRLALSVASDSCWEVLDLPPQTRETAAHRCAGAGSSWGLSNWVFKTKSHFVAQVCLKLTAALFQPPKYWDYRHEMSHLVQD